MSTQECVFVVVDPNDDAHVAFERAMLVAPLHNTPPKIVVLVTTDRDSVDTRAQNDKLYRNTSWFDEVIRQPLEERGLTYEIITTWCQEWQESILTAANNVGANRIFLPIHAKPDVKRLTFSESKWELLKTAKCPVVLVRAHSVEQRKTILAAVNFQATSSRQKDLNKKILERAQLLAEGYGAELHLVNGYMDSLHYPDRGKLANESKLPADKIHVLQGYTDVVVSQTAESISADLVILGTLGQNGKEKTRRGNTAERVISAVSVDTMIVNG